MGLTAKKQYFTVRVNDQPISQHVTEREAIERATTEREARPDTDRVTYTHDYEVEVSRLKRVIDDVKPSVPTGLTATPVSSTTIDLAWQASTDVSGIKNYDVQRNGVLQTPVASTSVSYTDLQSETLYEFQVRARDTAGNESGWSTPVSATTPGGGLQPWQLPAGSYTPSVQPPVFQHPRPNSETNAWERCRMAPAGIEYRIPISLVFGAWPFRRDVIDGPPGTYIEQYFDADGVEHHALVCPSPPLGEVHFKVRIRTQDFGRTGAPAQDPTGEHFQEWTPTFYDRDDTTRFVCLDAVNGNDANVGSFSSPKKTMAGFAAASTAGKQLWLREGRYYMKEVGFAIDLRSRAQVVHGYPGENAVIDYTGTGTQTPVSSTFIGIQIDAGAYIGNVTVDGSPDEIVSGTTRGYYHFFCNTLGDRITAFNYTSKNFDGKGGADTGWSNWSALTLLGNTNKHDYVGAVNCRFTHYRNYGNGAFLNWYSSRHWLVEGCFGDDAEGIPHGFLLKGRCLEGTARNNRLVLPATSGIFDVLYIHMATDGEGSNPGPAADKNEVCFNYLEGRGTDYSTHRAIVYGDGVQVAPWTGWVHRNTIVGPTNFGAGSYPATLYVADNVILSTNGQINNKLTGISQLTIVAARNELGAWPNRASFIDSKGRLLDSYLAAHGLQRGQRGHEVVMPAQSTPFFTDSFESGDFSHTENGAKWTSLTPQNVTVSTNYAASGTRSAKFHYTGNSDVHTDSSAELRFDLGRRVTNFWCQYDLRIPDNYQHREDPNPNGPENNKFFRLWGDDYNNWEKVGFSTLLNSPPDGYSTMFGEWDYTKTGAIGASGTPYPNAITAADRGTWVRFKINVVAPTPTSPGRIRLWKDGTLLIDQATDVYHDGEPHAYRYGYILGWANSGYTSDTDFYLDNVEMAESEAALSSSSTDLSQIWHFEDFSGAANGVTGNTLPPLSDAPGVVQDDPLGGGFKCLHDHIKALKHNAFGYGAVTNFPANLTKGDEVWVSTKILLGAGSDHSAGPRLKWYRVRTRTQTGTHIGYNDMLLNDNGKFEFIYEGQQLWSAPSASESDGPQNGVWVTYEMHIVFDNVPEANGGMARVEYWKNGEIIMEITNLRTLNSTTDQAWGWYLWTYWNDGYQDQEGKYPTVDQDWYWTNHAVAIKCAALGRDDSQYLATDAGGRKCIGVVRSAS